MKFYIRECSFVRCFSNSVLFGILCILCKSTKIAFHLYFLWTAEDQLLSILSSTIDDTIFNHNFRIQECAWL